MKSYLVTGANKGIGFAIVRRILLDIHDSFVFLGSRNVERGTHAVAELLKENAKFEDRVKMLELDVTDISSIKKAAKEVKQILDENPDKAPLVGLVNNAGGFGKNFQEMCDLNVRSVYQVTDQFLPLMAKDGRIVHISSGSAPNFVEKLTDKYQKFFSNKDVSWSEVDNLMNEVSLQCDSGSGFKKLEEMGVSKDEINNSLAYGFSKACLNCLTMIHAREYPDLKINSCTPGFIKTDLTTEKFGNNPSMKTPDEGTVSTMKLLLQDLEGNGNYYGSDGLRSPMHKYRSPGDPEYKD